MTFTYNQPSNDLQSIVIDIFKFCPYEVIIPPSSDIAVSFPSTFGYSYIVGSNLIKTHSKSEKEIASFIADVVLRSSGQADLAPF